MTLLKIFQFDLTSLTAGETGRKCGQKFLRIIRSDGGKFFGFGESNLPVLAKVEGRFAQILPPKAPDYKARLFAQALLQVKGLTIAKAGTTVRLPRSQC